VLLKHSCLLRGLVHRRRVDDVLEVLRDVGVSVVAELLQDLETVQECAVVLDVCLPLQNPNRVVYTTDKTESQSLA